MTRDWRISVSVACLWNAGIIFGYQASLRRHPIAEQEIAIEIEWIAAPAESSSVVAVAEAPVPQAAPSSDLRAESPPPPPIPKPEPIIPPPFFPPKPVEPTLEPTPEITRAKPEDMPAPKIPEPAPPDLSRVVPDASTPPPVPTKPAASSPATPVPETSPQQLARSAPVAPAASHSGVVGDGSSAKPGPDPTTLKARPGIRARPLYRKNPEPDYPASARRRRQEGLVMLAVTVTPQGRPVRVEVKQSSGVAALDEAALQAVCGWEFEPARIGSMGVESEIEVPVRFKLTN